MKRNLFNYDDKPVEKKKELVYCDLNIHQKINFRSNQGVFSSTVFRNVYYRTVQPLRLLSWHRKPVIDRLHKDYFTHYYLNAGSSNRLDNYLKAKNPNLFT